MGTPRVPLLWGHCRSSERLPLSLLHQPEKWPQISGGTRLGTSPMSPRGRFLGRGGSKTMAFGGKQQHLGPRGAPVTGLGCAVPMGSRAVTPQVPMGSTTGPRDTRHVGADPNPPSTSQRSGRCPTPHCPPSAPWGTTTPSSPPSASPTTATPVRMGSGGSPCHSPTQPPTTPPVVFLAVVLALPPTLRLGGLPRSFAAAQLHFHWGRSGHPEGAEHLLDGRRAPAEVSGVCGNGFGCGKWYGNG